MPDSDEHPTGDQRANQPKRDAAPDGTPEEPTLQMPVITPGAAEPAPPEPGDAEPLPIEREDVEQVEQVDEADDAGEVAAQLEPAPILEGSHVAVIRLSGAEDGDVTAVVGGEILIGRMADDLTVTLSHDQWVSRCHARITYRDGGWWIEDLKSSNGTFLGDDRTPVSVPTPLRVGQVFRVGHTDLMLTSDPDHLSHGAIEL